MRNFARSFTVISANIRDNYQTDIKNFLAELSSLFDLFDDVFDDTNCSPSFIFTWKIEFLTAYDQTSGYNL